MIISSWWENLPALFRLEVQGRQHIQKGHQWNCWRSGIFISSSRRRKKTNPPSYIKNFPWLDSNAYDDDDIGTTANVDVAVSWILSVRSHYQFKKRYLDLPWQHCGKVNPTDYSTSGNLYYVSILFGFWQMTGIPLTVEESRDRKNAKAAKNTAGRAFLPSWVWIAWSRSDTFLVNKGGKIQIWWICSNEIP